jgi:hypothetical protein
VGASADGRDDKDVDFFPFLVLYRSSHVQHFMGMDTVSTSMDLTTGVTSRDVIINVAADLPVTSTCLLASSPTARAIAVEAKAKGCHSSCSTMA